MSATTRAIESAVRNIIPEVVRAMRFVTPLLISTLLVSCASTVGDSASGSSRSGYEFSTVRSCKASDQAIKTSASCLTGDAACYQIADGSWCTGERGNLCPTGSTALAAGQTCPRGSRCFSISSELSCVIPLN